MWNYTKKVIDHFLHPRNVGEIENPDGMGEVGSLACGDMLRLTFTLDENGRIKDAKFKTFGCASAIASSSALTEMIKGKTLEEAEKITNRDIAKYLGGLPDEKMHCSVMGREALEAAIENYRGESNGKPHKLEGRVVCKCFGVTEQVIREAIRVNNLTTVDQITNFTKAGGGCTLCHDELKKILEEEKGLAAEAEEKEITAEIRPMTNVEKVHRVEELLKNRIAPALAHDGGGVELVDVDKNVVYVRLKGACASCPASERTMRQFIEKELQKEVTQSIRVEETK
jgi:NifU-like protein